MQVINKTYFLTGLMYDFKNCSLGIIAMPYKPFVIDKNEGIEVRLLKDIGKRYNIYFNITLANLSSSWGRKTKNKTWTGELGLLYEQRYFGIGNVDVGRDIDYRDFSFSYFYHNEPLVFVVPIAKLVPEWRVLTAIFNEKMWAICFGVLLVYSILFRLSAKYTEISTMYYKLPFLSSYQLFLGHATPKHPKNEILRVVFLSLSVFSIIISALYTSFLVFYLKNPIREHQPDQNADLVSSSDEFLYLVGGLKKYEGIFNSSSTKVDYLTASNESDTLDYWISKVGNNKNIWTVSSSFYAKFSLAENSNVSTDENGVPKVFVFKNKLSSYWIAMIARRGNPLLNKFDHILKRMFYSGIFIHYSKEYLGDIDKEISHDLSGDATLKRLTINQLQGAFFILSCGYIYAFIVFVIEIFIHKINKVLNEKKRKEALKIRRQLRKKNVKGEKNNCSGRRLLPPNIIKYVESK